MNGKWIRFQYRIYCVRARVYVTMAHKKESEKGASAHAFWNGYQYRLETLFFFSPASSFPFIVRADYGRWQWQLHNGIDGLV